MEKRRRVVWLVQLPLVVLWTLAFLVGERGDEGTLSSRVLRAHVYPTLRRMEGFYTDLKFRLRGAKPVKQKIVIVEIDDRAVRELGRWPWHRDAVAGVVLSAVEAGAKVVGLDIFFPEADTRVSEPVAELLKAQQLGDEIPRFETDLVLQRVISLARDKLVLGWMTDRWCRPAFPDEGACPVTDAAELARLPKGFDKFAYSTFTTPTPFAAGATPLVSTPEIVGNLPSYEEAAAHAGALVSAAEDPDNVVRRAQVALFVGGRPYPSLPLEMARVGLGDTLELALDGRGRVERVALGRAGLRVPVDGSGALAINFRGPRYHYPFVGAIDLLGEEETIPVQRDGVIEKRSRAELFKDAYVLVGLTAAGARDLRHFPFGSNVPGTEGLATILDNVLSGDALRRGAGPVDWRLLLFLMTVGAALLGFAMLRLDALPSMLLSIGVVGVLAVVDVAWVFARRDVDLNAIYLFGELTTLFVATVAVKYALEERGRKFIRGAFSKYLAPAVVDQMVKDPSKLRLGGELRKLTIMMSDLRGFTAMAERMKPAEVLSVLNHYLGTMADIITEHGGTIDEFIGDAILVIFGAPIEAKDDARRAVACAVAMQRAMKAINERNASLGLPKLEMGIALNTGEVIVGNIGSQKHIKYGVVGSHVNLTARIESNTVGGQVLISAETLALAGPDVKVGEKQMIVAKGFPEPIAAYDIQGIGGEYGLFLEAVDLELVDVKPPVAVRLRVMLSKNDEGPELAGRLVRLSALGAVLRLDGDTALEAFKNVKLRLVGATGELVEGDLYAKVIEGGAAATLRFTAVPPGVAAHIGGLVPKKR